MIKILAPLAKSGGNYHRIIQPLQHLNKEEFTVIFTSDFTKEEVFKDIDILYFHWTMPIPAFGVSLLKIKYGFKIIVDIDDSFEVPLNHIDYDYLVNGEPYIYNGQKLRKPSILNAAKDNAILADVVITTTKELQKELLQYNDKVIEIPNRIPFGEGQFIPKATTSDKIRIGICGSVAHYHDWQLLKPMLQKIKNDKILNSKIQWVICGYDSGNSRSKQVWDKIVNMFPTNRVISPTLPIDLYMAHYDKMDILLAPLENNSMNKAKSSLKILECAAKNVIFIGSNLYKEKSDIHYTVFIEDWYENIKMLCTRPPEFLQSSKNTSETNRKINPFQPVITQREQLCKSIL